MIEILDDKRREGWDAFVQNHAEGSFFHLAAWKDIAEDVFRFPCFYLQARRGSEIKGILPMALVRRPFFGAAMISMPLCVYGGALAENDEIKRELEDEAAHRAKMLGAGYLELRNRTQSRADWPSSDMFCTFRRILSADHEQNLKAIPRKQRAEVRRGMAAGLKTTHDHNADIFFRVYSESVRNLGTPVFPKKYVQALIKTFGSNCEITTVARDGNALASVLGFYFRDEVLPYYGGGRAAARDCGAYPYMYWEVMRRAVDRGIRVFDYGRSVRGSGAFAFKKNYGFEPQPLAYQYCMLGANTLPDMKPDSPRNKMITLAWKHLPLPVANKVGPLLYPVIA